MNRLWFQSRRLWLAFLPCLLLLASMVLFHISRVNPLYPALDKLTAVSLTERWSHPEMVKIRQLGKQAVPVLRRVLREKDAPSTRFLLWLKRKWPGVTRYYPYVPDAKKLSERRWAACQVLQTLGPAGRSATPDLIKIIASKDPGDVNGGSMALWAVGIDAEACQQLDEVMEKGMAGFGRSQIIMALANVKPPSDRTLKALTHALTDKSPYVAYYAAEALGRLGVASPAVISGLEKLVSTSTNDLTIVTASGALWELGKDSSSITGHVVPILEKQLLAPIPAPPGGGNGGQGVEEFEQSFLKSADLCSKMEPDEAQRAQMLGLLDSFCEKSGRIFIRMLLLPPMMKLGFPRAKCADVCISGLHQEEDYYRLQAAQLLALVAENSSLNEINLNDLIHDRDVGVRVYTAKLYWRKEGRPDVVVPILTEALDRKKYQSYYYPEIVMAALNALAEIGTNAHAAESFVRPLTVDPDPRVAELASKTLLQIGSR